MATNKQRFVAASVVVAAASIFATGCGTLQSAAEQASDALHTSTCDVALDQYVTAVKAIGDNLDNPDTAEAAAAQTTAETSCESAHVEAVKQTLTNYDSDCIAPIGDINTAKTAVAEQLRETERNAVEVDKAMLEADLHAIETSHSDLQDELDELQKTQDTAHDTYLVLAHRSSCPDRDVAAWYFYENDPWLKRTNSRVDAVNETNNRALALFAFLAGAPDGSTPDTVPDDSTDDDASTGGTVETLLNQLNALTVADEHHVGYDRELFEHWTDDDSDGCDTRREVLIAEATVPPTVDDNCWLSGGTWLSVYDDAVNEDGGRGFDVDHLVPLAEAWFSGAHSWNADTRQQFANDILNEHSLVAVSATSNRSKSAGDPADWMPPRQEAHCWYAEAWIATKTFWKLTIDPAEKQALTDVIDDCSSWTLGGRAG